MNDNMIFVGTPVYNRIDVCTARSRELMAADPRFYVAPFFCGAPVHVPRNELVELFLKSDSQYLLWLDADNSISIDGVMALVNTQADIVMAAYAQWDRKEGRFWCAGQMDKERREYGFISRLPPEATAFDIVGMGCTIVKRKVYETLDGLYYWADGERTEDIYFCEKAKQAGFTIALNPAVRSPHWKIRNMNEGLS